MRMASQKESAVKASRSVSQESRREKKGVLRSPSGDEEALLTRSQPLIKVWRMHRGGCRIALADSKLGGAAPLSALKWCGPYVQANKTGFYLYSPIDVDLSYSPDRDPSWSCTVLGHGYSNEDVEIMGRMKINHPHYQSAHYRPRTKLFLSGIHYEPQHTAQIWTGCVFQMPPTWALWIRSPINRGYEYPFRIEEAILEADWLHYDISMNLRFFQWDVTAKIRRDGPPLAHLVPIPSQAYRSWAVQENLFDPNNEEAQKVFDFWVGFDWDKFYASGTKDSATYHKRRRILKR